MRVHDQQIPAAESLHALTSLSRLRHTAIVILGQHILYEGRCRICQSAGICPAAALAENNLAIFGDLEALPPGDADRRPSSTPP